MLVFGLMQGLNRRDWLLSCLASAVAANSLANDEVKSLNSVSEVQLERIRDYATEAKMAFKNLRKEKIITELSQTDGQCESLEAYVQEWQARNGISHAPLEDIDIYKKLILADEALKSVKQRAVKNKVEHTNTTINFIRLCVNVLPVACDHQISRSQLNYNQNLFMKAIRDGLDLDLKTGRPLYNLSQVAKSGQEMSQELNRQKKKLLASP